VEAFSDANFVSDKKDRKSVSGGQGCRLWHIDVGEGPTINYAIQELQHRSSIVACSASNTCIMS
jgi:hypothetical protein